MNLVGYLNRSRVYPAVLMPIGEESGCFYAFWPAGDVQRFTDTVTQADLEKRDSFVALPEEAPYPRQVPRLAFAFSPTDIVSGSTAVVERNLRQRLGSLAPSTALDVTKFLHALDDDARAPYKPVPPLVIDAASQPADGLFNGQQRAGGHRQLPQP